MLPHRIIVVGLVHNEKGEILICKMPPDRGVFPGQWGLPGGGIEDGETLEAALRRELEEEIGIEVTDIQPLFFTDGIYTKTFSNEHQQEIYMIFLVFSCLAGSVEVKLNTEFEAYAWVSKNELSNYDLNGETIKTFTKAEMQ
jgi:nucleoside triphosphatase